MFTPLCASSIQDCLMHLPSHTPCLESQVGYSPAHTFPPVHVLCIVLFNEICCPENQTVPQIKKTQTWAIDSGSSGLWSLKPVYCPEDVDLRMGGLSIFFSESCLLMLVRLPWPGLRRRSGLSALRLRFWRRALGLQWGARLGEPRSMAELDRGWGGCTGQWPSLLLPGRLRGGGGSDLFLCLHQWRSGVKTSCSDPT